MRLKTESSTLLNVGERLTPLSVMCMKICIRSKRFVSLAALCASLAFIPETGAGLIKILKGDQEQESPKTFQRVGFVGCAKVKEVTGTVEYLDGIDHWIPLNVGVHLREGDLIRASQGRAVLQMCESTSLVNLTPQTVARLVPLNGTWDHSALSGFEARSGYIVRALHGKAYVQTPRMEWKSIGVNDVLPKGALVRAEETASVNVFNSEERRILRIESGGEMQLGSETAQAQGHFIAIAKRK